MKTKIVKIISLLTLVVFSFNTLGISMPAGFEIPSRLGKVRESRVSAGAPVVIHIQDAHSDYSAQMAIAGIVGHLADTYGVDLAFLEGGKGSYDHSIYTRIRDLARRRRVSDYFVRQGRLSGAEYFAVNSPGKVELHGIEDAELYFKNLDAYRKSLTFKDEALKHIDNMAASINNRKEQTYSPEMKELDAKSKLGIGEYVRYLDKNGDCPRMGTVPIFSALLDREKEIDFAKANKERAYLIDKIHGKLSKNALETLAKMTVQFKNGDIEKQKFYAWIFDKARFSGVEYDELPNLIKYRDYIRDYEALDTPALFRAVDELGDELMTTLAKTEEQKELYKLDKNLGILKKMFEVALVRREFDYYIANKSEFGKMGTVPKGDCPHFSTYIDEMENFYSYSFKRDEAFLRAIDAKLKKSGKRIAALVTGGFHTENLKKLFEEAGYSYISVMPAMKETKVDNPYFGLLAGGKTPFEKVVETAFSNIPVEHVDSEISPDEKKEAHDRTVQAATELDKQGKSPEDATVEDVDAIEEQVAVYNPAAIRTMLIERRQDGDTEIDVVNDMSAEKEEIRLSIKKALSFAEGQQLYYKDGKFHLFGGGVLSDEPTDAAGADAAKPDVQAALRWIDGLDTVVLETLEEAFSYDRPEVGFNRSISAALNLLCRYAGISVDLDLKEKQQKAKDMGLDIRVTERLVELYKAKRATPAAAEEAAKLTGQQLHDATVEVVSAVSAESNQDLSGFYVVAGAITDERGAQKELEELKKVVTEVAEKSKMGDVDGRMTVGFLETLDAIVNLPDEPCVFIIAESVLGELEEYVNIAKQKDEHLGDDVEKLITAMGDHSSVRDYLNSVGRLRIVRDTAADGKARAMQYGTFTAAALAMLNTRDALLKEASTETLNEAIALEAKAVAIATNDRARETEIRDDLLAKMREGADVFLAYCPILTLPVLRRVDIFEQIKSAILAWQSV